MKRLFSIVLTAIIGCSFCFMFSSCIDKGETDDNCIRCSSHPIGAVSITSECKKVYDLDSVEIDCGYGYTNKNLFFSPSGHPGYEFEKVVFMCEFYSLENLQQEYYYAYNGIKQTLEVTENYYELFDKRIPSYQIIREISKDVLFTNEYLAKEKSKYRNEGVEYCHWETIKIGKEKLLPKNGSLRFSLRKIFYSAERNNYIVDCDATCVTAGILLYTINGQEILFERVPIEATKEGEIIIKDSQGNILIDGCPHDIKDKNEELYY